MLTNKTIRGAGWSVSSRLFGRLIDFLTVIVLARTLSPADFGLTALAMTLVVIAQTVLEIPLSQALTRLNSIRSSHLDTAFTLGVLRGILLALIVLSGAWPFAVIYGDGRLAALVAVLAIGPIARGLYSPRMVEFIRDMSFGRLFVADLVGKAVASPTAILIAYLGGSYWAVVASIVLSPFVTTVASYLLAPYRPAFAISETSDFLSFIGWFSSAQILSALNWQLDRGLLGQFVSKYELGQYSMASDLAVLPTQSLIGPAMQPLMAAFSRISHDPERVRNAYMKASRITMLLAAPACVGISLTADLLVKLLLGPQWEQAAALLHWISLTILLTAYYQPIQSLALATDRPDLLFRLSAIELGFRVVLLPLGFYLYSIAGVVVARGALSIIMFVLCLRSSRSILGVSIVGQLMNMSKVMVASAVMAVCVFVFRHYLGAMRIGVLFEFAFVATFGAAVFIGMLTALRIRLS